MLPLPVRAEKHDHCEDTGYEKSSYSEQFPELCSRHTSYEHHHENHYTKQCRRGKILKHDERNEEHAYCQYISESLFVGSFLGLHRTQNLRHSQYKCALGYLRRLELNAHHRHPPVCPVGHLPHYIDAYECHE